MGAGVGIFENASRRSRAGEDICPGSEVGGRLNGVGQAWLGGDGQFELVGGQESDREPRRLGSEDGGDGLGDVVGQIKIGFIGGNGSGIGEGAGQGRADADGSGEAGAGVEAAQVKGNPTAEDGRGALADVGRKNGGNVSLSTTDVAVDGP